MRKVLGDADVAVRSELPCLSATACGVSCPASCSAEISLRGELGRFPSRWLCCVLCTALTVAACLSAAIACAVWAAGCLHPGWQLHRGRGVPGCDGGGRAAVLMLAILGRHHGARLRCQLWTLQELFSLPAVLPRIGEGPACSWGNSAWLGAAVQRAPLGYH